MGGMVCFIDDDGQVGTCIKDDENCVSCNCNDDAHKKWVGESKIDLSHLTTRQLVDELCKRKVVSHHTTPAKSHVIFIGDWNSGDEIIGVVEE
jgi:hypothetical protein